MISSLLALISLLVILLISGYLRLSLVKTAPFILTWLAGIFIFDAWHNGIWFIAILCVLSLVIIYYEPLRLKLISRPALRLLKQNLPRISDTEQQALEAGNTWWDPNCFLANRNGPIYAISPAAA